MYPGRKEPPVTCMEKMPWLLILIPSQGRPAHRDMLKQVPQVSAYFSQISSVISRSRINTSMETSAKNDNILLKTHTPSKTTYLQEERTSLNASSLG